MVPLAPNPIDITDFQFKAHCRLKVFDNENNNDFGHACNLVSVASRYGLIFIGSISNDLQVVQVKHIEDCSKEVATYKRRLHSLPAPPVHLSSNCDSSKLAIVTHTPNGPFVYIYDLLSFLSQNVKLLHEIRLSANANCKVRSIDWNPALPSIFTVCKDDGSLAVYDFKGVSYEFNELGPESGSVCFCWSPKGKQIAVGSCDGRITQYQPTLRAVRVIEAPEDYNSITTLCWISSFQFMAIYLDSNDAICLICVCAPKQGAPQFTNFEDVCYGSCVRPHQFYFIHQQQWNVLFVASANSMEVGILGMENSNWIQWTLSDNCRAELPLVARNEDMFPIGICFSLGASSYRAGNEIKQAPMLMMLSNQGVLCTFHALNLRPNSTDICLPLENVPDRSGDHLYTNSVASIAKPLPQAQILQSPQPSAASFAPLIPATTTGVSILPVPQVKAQPALFAQLGNATVQTPKAPIPVIPPPLLPNPTLELPISHVVTPEISPLQITPIPNTPDCQLNGQMDKLPINDETNAVIAQLIREKCENINFDVRNILQRGRAIDIKLGSENELSTLEKCVENMKQFYTEIKENTDTLDSEIYTLNQNLIQTWACFEESRTRFQTSKDPLTKVLLQSLPLDPASQQQLDDITYMIYYLDSQIQHANQALDERWDTFQTSLKKPGGLPLPTMESIYQTMVQHSKTTQKLKCTLKHIMNRIKSAHRSSVLFNVSLAERYDVSQLEKELPKLIINSEHKETIPQRFSRLLVRQSNLNVNKCKKLQSMIARHETTRICASKPQFNNSTVHLSTFLTGPLSPIKATKTSAKSHGADQMVMSTPKPQEIKILKQPVQTFTPPHLLSVQESTSVGSFTLSQKSSSMKSAVTQASSSMHTLITPVPGTGSIQVVKPVSTSSHSLFATTTSSTGFSFSKFPQYNASTSSMFSASAASSAPSVSATTNATPFVSKNLFGNAPQHISSGKPFTFGQSNNFPVSASSTPTPTETTAASPMSLGKTPLLATPTIAPSFIPSTSSVFNFSNSASSQQSIFCNKAPVVASTISTSTGSTNSIFGGSSGLAKDKSPFSYLAAPTTATSSATFNFFTAKISNNIFGSSTTATTTSSGLSANVESTATAKACESSVVAVAPTATAKASESSVVAVAPIVPATTPKPSVPVTFSFATNVTKPTTVCEKTSLGMTSTTTTITVTTPSTCINSTSSGGPPLNATPTATISPFGTNKPATSVTPGISLFGGNSSNIFGNTSTPVMGATSTTSAPPFFATTTTGSFFSTTQAPAFGAAAFGTVPATSVVGTATATTTGNLFGQAPATSVGSFGQLTAATSVSSPFGGGGTRGNTFSSNSSIFDQTTFITGSIFGGGTTPTTSVFGSPISGFVFGQASAPSPFAASSNAFGQTSPFAKTNTTTTSSGFGQSTSTFGSPSTFGSSPPFGNQAGASPGTFGSSFGSLTVGSATSPAFGQTTTPVANPFGKPIEQKSAFGSTTGSLFSAPVTTSSSNIFGSSTATNKSIFGGAATFGNSTFGMPQVPTGAFSGGGQSVQQSGFGRSPLFQNNTFGGGPTFGQSSTFGVGPSFGGAPSFGGGAAFGNPQKVFGSGADTGATFGSAASPQETTFGSLAQQDTVGFGNLAQQASQPPPMPFSGGSSFTNWRN